ncbi:uncharacterized protein [Melanerpes formicivorus]|uniref:uncharacterized protein n=1 Tax=Melanerpes formicivorus TaxID=211600 RepID=UPI00358FDB9B
MEKEVALSLFQCFLEKRKAEISSKVIPGLWAHGSALWHFPSGDSYFDEACWREYGNKLWDLVIDGDKTAIKLQKPWRECINCIKKYKLEQRMAAAVTANLSERDAAPVVSELRLNDMFEKYRPIDRGRPRYISRRPHRVCQPPPLLFRLKQRKSRKRTAKPVPQCVRSRSSTSSSDIASEGSDSEDSNSADFALRPPLENMERLEARGYGILTTTPLPRPPMAPAGADSSGRGGTDSSDDTGNTDRSGGPGGPGGPHQRTPPPPPGGGSHQRTPHSGSSWTTPPPPPSGFWYGYCRPWLCSDLKQQC